MDEGILPLVVIGIGGLALLTLAAKPGLAKTLPKDLASGTLTGLQIGVQQILTGRTPEAGEELSKRQGTILLGQQCAVNSDCSLNMTSPGPGGDAFSKVGCIRGVCDERNSTGLGVNVDPPRGSRFSNVSIDALKTNNLYKGNYRTVGVGSSCTSSKDCSGTGITGDAPNSKNVKCCQGECKIARKDYLGIPVCPEKCKKSLFKKVGTCNISDNMINLNYGPLEHPNLEVIAEELKAGEFTGPTPPKIQTKGYNGNCSKNSDCSGTGHPGDLPDSRRVKCCKGKCKQTKTGFLGAKICP